MEPAYHLFKYEEDGWSVQGHFESIMKCKPTDEDYVEWLEDEWNKKIICILGVSYLLDSL